MKVKCLKCGFTYEIEGTGGEMCPECGCRHWHMKYPFEHRIEKRKEGLAFEIVDIKDGNKVRVRKIYLDGHIEGFKDDPLVTNHVYPKFIRFKAVIVDMIRQINEDYMRLAERHIMADMPIAKELDCLKKAYLERINNIKI